MKLKYLLPAATIASVATVVTPLVTSCGSGATCTWKAGETYKPMTPKEKVTYKDATALTVAYHDDVKANKKIYSDDMINYIAKYAKEEAGCEFNKVSYTTKKVGDIEEIPNNSKPESMFRIDFAVVLDGKIPLVAPKNNASYVTFDNRKLTFTNMPVACFYDPDGSVEINMPSQTMIMDDKKWTINMPELKSDGTSTITLGSTNKDYNYKSVPEIMDDQLLFTFVRTFVEFAVSCGESNYYSNAVVDK